MTPELSEIRRIETHISKAIDCARQARELRAHDRMAALVMSGRAMRMAYACLHAADAIAEAQERRVTDVCPALLQLRDALKA